jgi:hypothetical protein
MSYLDFRKDYLENVKAVAAADNLGTQEAFVQVTCGHLVGGEIFDDYNISYYSGQAKRRRYKVDAYTYDEYDNSVALIIAEYSGEDNITTLTQTEAQTLFGRLRVVVEESISGRLRNDVEISTPAYDLVDLIYVKRNELRKIKFFIITDKEMSGRISSFDQDAINNIPCEYHLWDIVRLHRMLQTDDGHEPVEIDLTRFSSNGLPCLPAHSVSSRHVTCYLSVLPGVLLADIYDAFGSRLLEGNVRTFLSARGNVNKGIRRTILSDEKDLFFAYNNGIAATASEVETISVRGQLYLKNIKNFQIVNGGQTTASLSNTRYKDKASLDSIFVQMKLTVVEDATLAGEIIPNISRYANSQNKVSEADFFSNHEFNIRMQQISRRIWAPAVLGSQNETHWFYERARGQYENEQAKMTPSQKKAYAQINPKSQLFDKTMLAKLDNSWRGFPHVASAGAQKSFKWWAETIVSEWEKDDSVFNEQYFRKLVAVLIIFRFLEKNIPKQTWYESGYRANIVVYTISYFNHLVSVQRPDKVLDRNAIWSRQGLTDVLEKQLIVISEHVFRHITDENRPVINVTEWCKKEACWEECKKRPFGLYPDIENDLAYIDNIKDEERTGRKQRKMQSAIEQTIEVVNRGADFWKKVSMFLLERKLLNPKEMSILSIAVQMDRGKLPSDKQSAIIMGILDKARDEGFPG